MTVSFRDAQKLWGAVKRGGVVKMRGTQWTTGGGYWIAHTSRVPLPTHKKIETMEIRGGSLAAYMATIREGNPRPVKILDGDWWTPHYPENHVTCIGINPSHRVIAAFDSGFFQALHTINSDCELRLEPWSGAATWWHPRGYPVALLLAFYTRPELRKAA